MKKHIDGIIYNTDNMEVIGTWDNGRKIGHEFYYAKSLLRKNNSYFLHLRGGENTDLRVRKDGVWRDGEDLLPITPEIAQGWALEYLDVDSILKVFPGTLAEED